MKKILYVGNKLSAHGFTATSIETLGPLLAREGFVMRYTSEVKNKPLRLLDMLFQTLRYGRRSDYVLIDTYSTSNFWYAFAVSQLCRVLGVRYVPILRGGELPSRLRRSPRTSRMIFKNAYANVAPSQYLFHAFADAGFSRLVHIPNSIETAKYPFRERSSVGPKLLWVRSFAAIYNPEMALTVFAAMRQLYPDARLCMVGPDKNGYLGQIKQSAQRQGLSVTFTGKLSKPEWTALAASYDLFINTTHFDNMPVSVIEAMALGLPVVSTNVGGIPFLLEHGRTALLVDDDDAAAMVGALQRLIAEPGLASGLAQNAARLVAGFDFDRIKQQWVRLLE